MLTRRGFVGSALIAYSTLAMRDGAYAARQGIDDLTGRFTAIEKETGGRLGVAGIDTATGRRFGHRQAESFAMCSTFKVLAVSALLVRVEHGKENLHRRVHFAAGDVIEGSPISKDHFGDGMTLAEVCAAALDYSDNTAANMILSALGGPHAVTAFARSLGDPVTRLDRTEPTLNEATPHDPRDTTTPAAMLGNLQKLLLGNALTPASRERLTRWMIANKTGDARLRAGWPHDWRIGDKTGTGEHGTANDIAIAWPPGREPIVMAVYLTESTASPDRQNAAIAEVARAIAATIAPP
ncbi:MAG TPA: class A beta-lactamase [Stellaceae bacterium]|jgi:beta-lactamase class A